MATPQRQYNAPELPEIVKAEQTELHYVGSRVTIHAAGCQDRADEKRPFDVETSTRYVDDWYYVAPCAKRKTPKPEPGQ